MMPIYRASNVSRIIGLFTMFFLISFAIERYLENLGKVDSIGNWYTSYCAVIYSSVLTAVVVLIIKWRNLSSELDEYNKLSSILFSIISIAVSAVFIVFGISMTTNESPFWIVAFGFLTILYGSVNTVLIVSVWLRVRPYLNKVSTYSAIAFMVLTIAASLDNSMISGLEWGGIVLVVFLITVNWYALNYLVKERNLTLTTSVLKNNNTLTSNNG